MYKGIWPEVEGPIVSHVSMTVGSLYLQNISTSFITQINHCDYSSENRIGAVNMSHHIFYRCAPPSLNL